MGGAVVKANLKWPKMMLRPRLRRIKVLFLCVRYKNKRFFWSLPRVSTVSVVLNLKPLPNTPIIKANKFYIEKTRKISWLLQWLKQNLKCDTSESVVSILVNAQTV